MSVRVRERETYSARGKVERPVHLAMPEDDMIRINVPRERPIDLVLMRHEKLFRIGLESCVPQIEVLKEPSHINH